VTFATREEAGRLLGRYVKARGVRADLVLGLPRGGVIVAAGVALELALPLDVLIVRKIGHPSQREFAVGAIAEPDIILLNPSVVAADAAMHRALKDIIHEEQQRLQHHRATFHPAPLADLHGQSVILVDDGLATGATTEAAVLAARKLGAAQIIVATPVASGDAVRRLGKVANEVIALHVDDDFDAVGRYYDVFSQTSDEEVLQALRERQKASD
jgi:putative phosphoribosyl transferase